MCVCVCVCVSCLFVCLCLSLSVCLSVCCKLKLYPRRHLSQNCGTFCTLLSTGATFSVLFRTTKIVLGFTLKLQSHTPRHEYNYLKKIIARFLGRTSKLSSIIPKFLRGNFRSANSEETNSCQRNEPPPLPPAINRPQDRSHSPPSSPHIQSDSPNDSCGRGEERKADNGTFGDSSRCAQQSLASVPGGGFGSINVFIGPFSLGPGPIRSLPRY